jgi:tetratricopeptide (TPR) repeat protein
LSTDGLPRVALHTNLGDLAFARGELKSAQGYYERALAESNPLGKDLHQDTRDALAGLGRTLLAQGRPKEALRYLQRALPKDPTSAAVTDLSLLRFSLAQALVGAHGDAQAAQALASQARAGFLALGPRGEGRVREVDAWLRLRTKAARAPIPTAGPPPAAGPLRL